jgi:hypothetical protein
MTLASILENIPFKTKSPIGGSSIITVKYECKNLTYPITLKDDNSEHFTQLTEKLINAGSEMSPYALRNAAYIAASAHEGTEVTFKADLEFLQGKKSLEYVMADIETKPNKKFRRTDMTLVGIAKADTFIDGEYMVTLIFKMGDFYFDHLVHTNDLEKFENVLTAFEVELGKPLEFGGTYHPNAGVRGYFAINRSKMPDKLNIYK